MRTDEHVWKYDPEGPYDVDQMLKEQARKNEEALNAELEKMQKEALEQARRNSEAPKLFATAQGIRNTDPKWLALMVRANRRAFT